MANDIVVLTHVKIKLKQTVETNAQLTEEANSLSQLVSKVRRKFCMSTNVSGYLNSPGCDHGPLPCLSDQHFLFSFSLLSHHIFLSVRSLLSKQKPRRKQLQHCNKTEA